MISPLLQKILALLVLGAALFVFAVIGPLPYLNWINGKQAELEILESRVEILNRVQEKTTLYGEALENKDPEQLASLLYQSETPALASAALQGEFTRLAREADIHGGSFRPLSPETHDGLTRFGFRVTLQAPTYDFLVLIEKLQSTGKALYIDDIKVKAPHGKEQDTRPRLNIQMEVYGFMEARDG